MRRVGHLLNANDFATGLNALDVEIGRNVWLSPYTPIILLSAGGYLAVAFLGNRESTGDLDYLLEPQWAYDDDVTKPLSESIKQTGRRIGLGDNWANEEMAFFVPSSNREYLFKEAVKQNIVLWGGMNIKVLAVPLEWALERKLRRIHHQMQDNKRDSDLNDALALLRYLKEKKGSLLDRHYIQRLNICSRELPPDEETMDKIVVAYREKFKEEIFA
ncbi:hypothetical protein BDV28DRAFT_155624 [Aspergillus coremiiformis]|uniref:DUF7582 domain-containing protein n=1 Tax=Aspergillus coremiiformis TaxID=138285 RepID=A0A5N6ZBS8_9EURO|nr:hypothetical protein BDV28DRAFT_155624 [Aspergillus coremiiformis]